MNEILPNYIDGEFVFPGERFDNISPVNGVLVNKVTLADKGMVDAAVMAARDTLTDSWGKLDVNDRSDLLHAVADGIDGRFDDFVEAEIADTGKSLKQACNVDVPRGAANFRTFADMAKSLGNRCFESAAGNGGRVLNYSVRKPLGVVAVISPWNLPLLLLTWKVAPAMAVGNAVIAKPSEETPSTATLLAEVMDAVGVPKGAFNLVHGFGSDSVGEFLTAHPGVDAITFTGETRTGSAIMKSAADTVKSVSFELGGKNAALVFGDCNFEAAVKGTAQSVFTNGGQVCLCTERVYVERDIFEAFVSALKQEAEALRLDWPGRDTTDMGPMISRQHRDKVLGYYRLAEIEGATAVTGGSVPKFGDERDAGAWIEPTIYTGLAGNARFMREEVFGPVCHIMPFDSEEQAVRLANDSDYGLAATLWTTNLKRAHSLARQLEVGLVWINSWYIRDLRTPFGGVKLSGIGREGGEHSLNFYSEPTNVCIQL